MRNGRAGDWCRSLARVVGIAGGAGVWLLLDSIALFADEQLTRDEFEAELAELVDEQRA